jgi:hypothetical protein
LSVVNNAIEMLPDSNRPQVAPFCIAGVADDRLNILINQYEADGAGGILPHTDGPAYEPCVSILSFGASVPLTFQPQRRKDNGDASEETCPPGLPPSTAAPLVSASQPIDRDDVQREIDDLEVELLDRLAELEAEATSTDAVEGDVHLGKLAGWFHEAAAFRWHQLQALLQLAWLGITPQQVAPVPPAWACDVHSSRAEVATDAKDVGPCSVGEGCAAAVLPSLFCPPPNAEASRPFSVLLPPRSLICFWGSLYEQWLHGISPAAPLAVDFLPAVSTVTSSSAAAAATDPIPLAAAGFTATATARTQRLSAFGSFIRYRKACRLTTATTVSVGEVPCTAPSGSTWTVVAAAGNTAGLTAFNGALAEIIVNVRTGTRTSLTYRRVRSGDA